MSHELISPMYMIYQCDSIILAASNDALEGGLLGKRVISVSPSIYHPASFNCNV